MVGDKEAISATRKVRGVIPEPVAVQSRPFRGNWEGSFLVYSSLATVNRELVLALLRSEKFELGLLQAEPGESAEVAITSRLYPVAERLD